MPERGPVHRPQLRDGEARRRQREADVAVGQLGPQPLPADQHNRAVVKGKLWEGLDWMPGGVLRDRRVMADRDESQIGGHDQPPWVSSGVAARLQLLKVGQLPDVDLGGQVPADRRLQRLTGAQRSPGQRPRAVERLQGPLPQQHLKLPVANLKHDGKRLMAGPIGFMYVAHRLSTHSRKLLDVRPPATPAARMFTDRSGSMPVPPASSPSPSSTRRLDVEAVLGAAGFRPFHRRAVAITGIAWTFVAMEILLVGFTLPLFGSIWGLSSTWLGWIGASALAGSLVGSLLLGRLADQIGRRRVFQASILWYSLFTALTALAWGPASLLALRFLAGIGLGGMLVVDPSLLAEYLPPQRRGRFLVLLDFFWPVGLLIAIALSWVFLDRLGGEWRWLFVAAALPAFLAGVVRRALPESPYWLARHGRLAEAAGVLGGITGHPVNGESLAVSVEPRSSPRELLGGRLRATSVVIILVWIALNVSYYGLFIWLPGVLADEGRITLNAYVLLALVALAQFPGYAASLWLVEAWGRRPTLATFLALG